jgi:multidrug efflux pump subunit AcrB
LGERLLQHPRIQAVNTNEKMDWYEKAAQELVLKVSEKDLATAGASLPQVFEAIREISPPANPQSNLNIQNQNYPVLLKATDAENFSRYAVLEEPLTLDSNRHITLKNAAVMELENTANTLVRENRSYVRMVGFDYLGSSHFGSQFLDKVLKELKPQLAAGYTIERESYSWDWNTAKRQYGLLFLLALAIFCICAVLFGKFKQSFYIVTMIPLSFIGLFLTFSWGDFYFDQGGYAAFVLLAGLVVNAAIFIVNDYNLPGQKTGVSASNSFLLESTLQRARTILLTVLSTGCSLIPFIWEGQQEIFWFSFATGSIGGLFASLWAVFFVLPVLMWKKEN